MGKFDKKAFLYFLIFIAVVVAGVIIAKSGQEDETGYNISKVV